jgi:hypothetical protein
MQLLVVLEHVKLPPTDPRDTASVLHLSFSPVWFQWSHDGEDSGVVVDVLSGPVRPGLTANSTGKTCELVHQCCVHNPLAQWNCKALGSAAFNRTTDPLPHTTAD